MKLTLNLDGKEKTFKSKTITFVIFRKGTEYMNSLGNSFLGVGYPENELDEAVEFVVKYFGCTVEEFEHGFEMTDSVDFFNLFQDVLNNIQLNDGRRKVEKDLEGK